MADYSRQLTQFDSATNGKDLREPIVSILEIANDSAGDVDYIVDEEGNKYTPKSLYTENQVYKIFTDIANSPLGKNNRVFLKALPKTTLQRKMALESQRIYSELRTIDAILDLILGT